jgi:TPR repeat protein
LAEAGFCYAQGIGCKKNLKKSAKFYRMAEAKGMSMVGNSWYVPSISHYSSPFLFITDVG